MQRTIKFRVWDINNKKWLFGGDSNNKCISFSCWDHNYFSVMGISQECLEIQQFTGLFDKHKTEIYEGDIIRFMGKWDEKGNVLPPDFKPYEVSWFMGGFHAVLIQRSYRSVHRHNEVLGVGHTDSEIIGNIFDKPELLQQSIIIVKD